MVNLAVNPYLRIQNTIEYEKEYCSYLGRWNR